MSTVRVWKVGQTTHEDLPYTPEHVTAQLLNDWLPGVPAGQGADFMGWPRRLLIAENGELCLSELVAPMERQWKGMVSWMLGVAGARWYLEEDGYRWIAPISAFYPNIKTVVATPSWHLAFPKPVLTVTRIKNRVLCPDYIAAERVPGLVEG